MRTTLSSGSFLRDDMKNWVGSSLFFMSLEKLGVDVEKYYIPTGVECSNDQLTYYADYLLDEVSRLEFTEVDKDYKDYVRKIAFILRAWAKAGHGIKVV